MNRTKISELEFICEFFLQWKCEVSLNKCNMYDIKERSVLYRRQTMSKNKGGKDI